MLRFVLNTEKKRYGNEISNTGIFNTTYAEENVFSSTDKGLVRLPPENKHKTEYCV
jgi:hypothetical protein